MYKELPEGYLSWAIRETEANDNSSDDLRRLAKWAKSRETTKGYTTPDPKIGAKIPYIYIPSGVSGKLDDENFSEGHGNEAKPRGGRSGDGQDAPEDVATEIQALQVRLAGLMDQVQCGQRAEDGEEVSTGEVFYDCFEGDSEEMIGAAQIEARARELRKAKNFSLGMCEDLLGLRAVGQRFQLDGMALLPSTVILTTLGSVTTAP